MFVSFFLSTAGWLRSGCVAQRVPALATLLPAWVRICWKHDFFRCFCTISIILEAPFFFFTCYASHLPRYVHRDFFFDLFFVLF